MSSIETYKPGYGIEKRSIDYIPPQERHGAVWHQGPFWFTGDFNFFTVAMGYIGPSLGLNFQSTCLASILGILFGTLFMALHASQGPDLGLPQMIQSRAQFGYRGVALPLFGTLCTFIGFNVIDTYLVAQGLNGLYGWNVSLISILLAVTAVVLAIYGHDWLQRVFLLLFWLGVPFYLFLSFGILGGSLHHESSKVLGFSWVAFSAQFAAAASYNITFAPYVSDYTRYLPKRAARSHLIMSVYAGASLSSIWLIVIGAWLACFLGATDGMTAINDVGNRLMPHGGIAIVSISIAALVAAMAMNAYSGMLTVVTGLDSFITVNPTKALRIVTILALGLGWYILASLVHNAAVGVLYDGLTLMLYLLAPWTAVNLVDYFLVRHARYAVRDLFRSDGIYGAWGWRGILAYCAGFLSSIPFFNLPGVFEGYLAKRMADIDISWLPGIAIAGMLYFALMHFVNLTSERVAIEASDRLLDDELTKVS